MENQHEPKKGGRSKTSKALGTIICPKCGETGQLKLRTAYYKGKENTMYLQVDHYKTAFHGSGYVRSCYLHRVNPSRLTNIKRR